MSTPRSQLQLQLAFKKLAALDPNLNLVYDKPKTNYLMPKHLRENRLSPDEASQLLVGMRSVAPHGALDKTRMDWHGLQIQGYGSRVHDNDRVTRLGRWLHQMDGDQFEAAYPDKTQGFGDAFLPFANLVTVPSGMGGTAMHELGHAIDFNAFPANSKLRHGIAALYRNYAPTLWKEHAAWKKGRKHVLDAYTGGKLDPKVTYKTLESGKGAKRVGLGSYWGAGLGTVGGVGAAIAGLVALNEMGVNLRDIPGRVLGLPIVGGAMLGGMGGIGLGNYLAKNPPKREKIVNMMAKSLARKQGIGYAEAHQLVEKQLAEKAAPSKGKKPATSTPAPLRKAANENLQALLRDWEAAGGSQSAAPMSANAKRPMKPLPPALAAALAAHLKLPKGQTPDELDAAEAVLNAEGAFGGPRKLASQASLVDPAFIAPLAGAAVGGGIGALTSKKDRLRNALIGAGIGGGLGGAAEYALPGVGLGGKYTAQDLLGYLKSQVTGKPGMLESMNNAAHRVGEMGEYAMRRHSTLPGLELAYLPGHFKKSSARDFGEKLALDLNALTSGGLGGAGLGAVAGGLYGALNPGEEETLDDEGNVTTRRKSRLRAALTAALGGAGIGGLAGAGLGAVDPDRVNNFGNSVGEQVRALFGKNKPAPQTPYDAEVAKQLADPKLPTPKGALPVSRVNTQTPGSYNEQAALMGKNQLLPNRGTNYNEQEQILGRNNLLPPKVNPFVRQSPADFARALGEEPNTPAAPYSDAVGAEQKRLAQQSHVGAALKQMGITQ